MENPYKSWPIEIIAERTPRTFVKKNVHIITELSEYLKFSLAIFIDLWGFVFPENILEKKEPRKMAVKFLRKMCEAFSPENIFVLNERILKDYESIYTLLQKHELSGRTGLRSHEEYPEHYYECSKPEEKCHALKNKVHILESLPGNAVYATLYTASLKLASCCSRKTRCFVQGDTEKVDSKLQRWLESGPMLCKTEDMGVIALKTVEFYLVFLQQQLLLNGRSLKNSNSLYRAEMNRVRSIFDIKKTDLPRELQYFIK